MNSHIKQEFLVLESDRTILLRTKHLPKLKRTNPIVDSAMNHFCGLHWFLWSAGCMFVFPIVGWANPPARADRGRNATIDVCLSSNGEFRGVVVEAHGGPAAGMPVSVERAGQSVGVARSDEQGRFVFSRMNAGSYQVKTPGRTVTCRCWTSSCAPPSARPRLMLVRGTLVRGQNGCPDRSHGHFDGAALGILGNPFITSGLTAAAIAVPIAAGNGDEIPAS